MTANLSMSFEGFSQACQRGDVRVVQENLARFKRALGARRTQGITPLMYAAMRGHADVVDVLLPHCNPKATDGNGETALMWGVEHPRVIERLLLCSDVKKSCNMGRTALTLAAEKGRVETVSLLLRLSDPLHMTNHRETALQKAAYGGHEEILKMLLPLSEPNHRNVAQRTALFMAAWKGHATIVEALQPLSDAMLVDISGDSPLMAAVNAGSHKSVALLLPVSDVHHSSNAGANALMLAKASNDISMVRRIERHVEQLLLLQITNDQPRLITSALSRVRL